jgi:hypothetical protein
VLQHVTLRAHMVKEPLVDQTTFKNSLRPGYSEGSDHTLQGPRWHLYLFIAGILKLLLASGHRNSDWSRSGPENYMFEKWLLYHILEEDMYYTKTQQNALSSLLYA